MMNEHMTCDYAIYCSAGLYNNREFYKFYSINNRDLIAYNTKLATPYEVEDLVYKHHKECILKCIQASYRNKRRFVKVEIDEDHITWVREVYTEDEIKRVISQEQYNELIKRYYKHWEIIREKRAKLEEVSREIEKLEQERDILKGWMPIGLYDADDELWVSDDEDMEESDYDSE